MKKLLTLIMAAMLALIITSAITAEPAGPPVDAVVTIDAAAGYIVTAQDQRAYNGVTLAGVDTVMPAALEALAATLMLAAIIAAVWTVAEITLLKSRGEDGSIGYHARDQPLAAQGF